MIKMVVALTLLSVISGFGLSAMYAVTKEPIKMAELNQVYAPKLKQIVPGFDNDPIADTIELKAGKDDKGRDIIRPVFPCKKGGEVFAVGVDASAGGFGGNIKVLVAIDVKTDAIMDVAILTHTETKGVGTKQEPVYLAAFKQLKVADPFDLKVNGGKIDGMSGATFSSKGIMAAAKDATGFYVKNKDSILNSAK